MTEKQQEPEPLERAEQSQEAGTAETAEQQPQEPQTLEDIFADFAQMLVKRLIAWLPNEPPQTQLFIRAVFQAGGATSFPHVQLYYEAIFMWHYIREGLEAVPEIDRCLRRHWDEGIPHLFYAGQPAVPPKYEELHSQLFRELLQPLVDALERSEPDEPPRDEILASYSRFKQIWINRRVRWDVTIPLVNFTCNLTQELPVGSHLQLAPFTDEEKTRVWNAFVPALFLPRPEFPATPHAFLTVSFRLAGAHTLPTDQLFDNPDIRAEVMHFISSLRLTKGGDIGAPLILERTEAPSVLRQFPAIVAPNDYRIKQTGAVYALEQSDEPALKKTLASLERLAKSKQHGGLEVALRRFNQSYTREIPEDQIIDLTIALESALLAPVDWKSELRYRFALRGAALLSGMQRKPRETQILLLALYDARSNVVHNGNIISEVLKDKAFNNLRQLFPTLTPQQFVLCCEDVARDVLREYVTRMTSEKEIKTLATINADLEQYIVNSLTPFS